MPASSTLLTLYINLDRSLTRREFMEAQLSQRAMPFIRIPAVPGRNLPSWLLEEFQHADLLTDGETGCYASHLLAAQRIVANCLPHAVVLEDDAVLDEDFASVVANAIKAAPQGWDIIHLSAIYKKTIISIASLEGHDIVQFTKDPPGAVAYLLSNTGARKWLNPIPRRRPNDIDNSFSWIQRLNIYGVYPSIAHHSSGFVSDTGHLHGPDAVSEHRRFLPHPVSVIQCTAWMTKRLGYSNFVKGHVLNSWNSILKAIDGKRRVSVIGPRGNPHSEAGIIVSKRGHQQPVG